MVIAAHRVQQNGNKVKRKMCVEKLIFFPPRFRGKMVVKGAFGKINRIVNVFSCPINQRA